MKHYLKSNDESFSEVNQKYPKNFKMNFLPPQPWRVAEKMLHTGAYRFRTRVHNQKFEQHSRVLDFEKS